MKKIFSILLFITLYTSTMDSDSNNTEKIRLFDQYKNDVELLNTLNQNEEHAFGNFFLEHHPEINGNYIQTLKRDLTVYWQEQVEQFKKQNDFSQGEYIDECYNETDIGCICIYSGGIFAATMGSCTSLILYLTSESLLTPGIALFSTIGTISLICGAPQLIKYCCVKTKKRNRYNQNIHIKLMKKVLKKMES